MKRTVLFISLGRTDLQVLGEKGGSVYRLSLGRNLRHFHQMLLDTENGVPWQIDAGAVKYPEAGVNNKVSWDLDKEDFRLPNGYSEYLSDDGNLVLVPAKLAPAMYALRDSPDIGIGSVVLFTTDRDEGAPPGVYHNEPVAAGPIIARWLGGEFPSLDVMEGPGEIGWGKIGWIDIMDGEMLSPGAGRDNPVNRTALLRVESAMRESQKGAGEDCWACLSLGGGMPEFKEPVKACAEYFFEGRTFSWQAPQYHSGEFAWAAAGEESPTVTDSYRVRYHVEKLVRRGAFVEAYGAASELESDEKEREWVEKVQYVGDYITGALRQTGGDIPPYIRGLWTTPRGSSIAPRCLLVGVRAEAALWARRIPEAVSATATFLDAAVLDAVAQALPANYELDDVEQVIKPRPGRGNGHDDEQMRDMSIKVCRGLPPARRMPLFSLKGGNRYGYTIGPALLRNWVRVFEQSTGDALMSYLRALNFEGSSGIQPIRMRNITVHSVLRHKEVNRVCDVFHDAKLWSRKPARGGEAFLCRRLASGVLKALGINNAPDLYRNLIEGLIADLRNYPIQ